MTSLVSVHPVKLAYRGVIIERPCVHCDTVNIHFEGLCQSGPCARCGRQRFDSKGRGGGIECGYDLHQWQGQAYHPADIEWPAESKCARCGIERAEHCNEQCDLPCWSGACEHHLFVEHAARAAFDAIVDRAREIGLPERYTSDLFRDYQRIVRDNVTTFVWAVRNHGNGTDIYAPGDRVHAGYHSAYYTYSPASGLIQMPTASKLGAASAANTWLDKQRRLKPSGGN